MKKNITLTITLQQLVTVAIIAIWFIGAALIAHYLVAHFTHPWYVTR